MANQDQKDILSKNLKIYLDRKGLSQTDLAKELGYPEMTVSNWVNAKFYPRIDKIQEMADFFGINKSDLMEDKSDDENTHFNEMVVMGFDGLDVTKMSEEDRKEYYNDLIDMMNMVKLKHQNKGNK